MKANYKKLGDYIQQVDVRNKENKCNENNLVGLSMTKEFRKSTSNIVGVDLSKYKIVSNKQFVCDFMSVIRVYKLPVVLNLASDVIVSPAYTVFKIKDETKLLPEYLMIWFRRSEFDRFAFFKCDSAVRGGFDWEDLCNSPIIVPNPTEQQRIVNAYNIVDRRIRLLQQINERLVKLGIFLVDKFISKSILLNMTDNEIKNTEKSLQKEWTIKSILDFCEKTESGSTPSRIESNYWDNGKIPWVKSGEVHNNITLFSEEYITEKALKETSTKLLPVDTVLMAMYGVTAGEVGYLNIEATTNQAICGMICKSEGDAAYLYFSLLQNQEQISLMSNGGAQNNLSKNFIENLKIIAPPKVVIERMNLVLLIKLLKQSYEELSKLQDLKQLIISRISEM